MKKKEKGKTLKCEHCESKKKDLSLDVAKWICSKCVEQSMQGVNLDDANELENTDS